jgi:hypothetical protein
MLVVSFIRWGGVDKAGNIPRFITNSSLPNSIAEDVPSFLSWIERKFPDKEAGGVDSTAL